jgi:hypothetical protein
LKAGIANKLGIVIKHSVLLSLNFDWELKVRSFRETNLHLGNLLSFDGESCSIKDTHPSSDTQKAETLRIIKKKMGERRRKIRASS